MRSLVKHPDVWLAALVPLLAYGALTLVSEAYYGACCGGIPDAGRVPVQFLPDFLLAYRPSSLSLWIISSSMFAVPGFLAGRFSRRRTGALAAGLALLLILVHAGRAIWQWQESFARFADEVIHVEYVRSEVVLGTAVAISIALALTVVGAWAGRRSRLRRSEG